MYFRIPFLRDYEKEGEIGQLKHKEVTDHPLVEKPPVVGTLTTPVIESASILTSPPGKSVKR
jgi:hypothetical protein